MRTLVCWFRRDLRVRDHTALYHAARDAERVTSLFMAHYNDSCKSGPFGEDAAHCHGLTLYNNGKCRVGLLGRAQQRNREPGDASCLVRSCLIMAS